MHTVRYGNVVSSSGHLVLLNRAFGHDENFLFVSVLLHVATLFSVIICFRKEIFELIRHPFSKQARRVYVATLVTLVIVLVFKSFLESAFDGRFLSVCFIISAILLMLVQFKTQKTQKYTENTYKKSIFIGIMQGFAVLSCGRSCI